jgi:hypothetical protein
MIGTAATSNMQGFDFTSTWETVSGGYPVLSWQTSDSDGGTQSPVEGVSDALWTAVTGQDGDAGSLSLSDLGDAIQAYQSNPSNADIDGVTIGLSDLGDLIQYYQNVAA